MRLNLRLSPSIPRPLIIYERVLCAKAALSSSRALLFKQLIFADTPESFIEVREPMHTGIMLKILCCEKRDIRTPKLKFFLSEEFCLNSVNIRVLEKSLYTR